MITDGDKEAADGSYVELGPFVQHVTVDLEQSYGPIRVVGLHGFIPNNNLGPEYGFFARLLFDRLWLDVFYLEEDMDRHTAQAITDEVCHLVGDSA